MISKVKKYYDFYLTRRAKLKVARAKQIEKKRHGELLSSEQGSHMIRSKIESAQPSAIGKIGTTELKCLHIFSMNPNERNWDSMKMKDGRYFGGIFPDTPDVFEAFSEIYIRSIQTLDILGLWYNKHEYEIVQELKSSPVLVDSITFLEPFYFEEPWSASLRGKKVLVVHPFENSILHQYHNKVGIWENPEVLPDMELLTLKVPQNAGVQKPLFKDWIETFEYLKGRIETLEFDVALIGAGGWSIPLCAFCKSLGKIGIHMGGGLQIYFGIKGGRWNSHEKISKFYNQHWTNVLKEDMPEGQEQISLIPKFDQYW